MKSMIRAALAAVLLAAGSRAAAQTVTTTFPVSATVVASCQVTATALAFPNYDAVAGAAVDGQSALTVTCTQAAPYTVALDAGANSAVATAGARAMVNGANHLDYNLYSDAGRTTPWGGATTVAGTGTGLAQTVNVYGRIPASQNVPALTYGDTVTVAVSF